MVATSCLTAPLGAGGCPLLISGSVSFSSRLRLLLRYCSKQQTPRQAINRSSPPSIFALPLIGLLEPLAAVAATRVVGGIGDTSTMRVRLESNWREYPLGEAAPETRGQHAR